MTLQELIQDALDKPLSVDVLKQEAIALNVSLDSLVDAFAREVAEGYFNGKYSWESGDAAMNSLYSCAYFHSDFGLSDFAWLVFEAFDEGEYIHNRDCPALDGEQRTKALLAPLVGRPCG